MPDPTVLVPADTLRAFIRDTFIALNVPTADADICADVLIASDLRGIESHGIARLKMYFDRIRAGIQSPTTDLEIVNDRGATAVADGHHGMGHVIATRAMQLAIDKAKDHGLGAVAVRNSSHYGIAAYYPLMAVRNNMAGLTTTNARPSVAPTFGVEPVLGTNPLTFACPTDEPVPFVIDCATSTTQRGKIEVLDRERKPAHEGWAIDNDARPITDPTALLNGLLAGTAALLPLGGAGELLGGHKGYGYATMAEILSAALQAGGHTKDLADQKNARTAPYAIGHFFLAIDIAHFIDPDSFKKTAGDICRTLRSSKKAPGHTRIWTAGEKEYEAELRRRREGIPITPALQADIALISRELRLRTSRFPWTSGRE